MRIYIEQSLRNFEFWSGAVAHAEQLTCKELDQLDSILMDTGDDWEDVQINDLMWFDFESVCDWLGLEYDRDKDEIIRN